MVPHLYLSPIVFSEILHPLTLTLPCQYLVDPVTESLHFHTSTRKDHEKQLGRNTRVSSQWPKREEEIMEMPKLKGEKEEEAEGDAWWKKMDEEDEERRRKKTEKNKTKKAKEKEKAGKAKGEPVGESPRDPRGEYRA